MRQLRLFACVVAISAIGGMAAHFTGGAVHRAIGWFTPMVVGVVVGFWLAKS